MAIAVTKTLSTGVVGTYARILGLTWEATSGSIYLNVGLFLDQPSFAAGKEPVFQKTFTVTGDLTTATALFNAFYNRLMNLPDFQGGTIVP